MVAIRQIPPQIPDRFRTINGGRVQSITVNPTNSDYIIVANQFGGLWKTTNRGRNWFHVDTLPSVFVRDVVYAPDGNTVIATVARDNRVINGGGIWVSRDWGESWIKVDSGDPHLFRFPDGSRLPNMDRVPDRISAYGISYAPDDRNMVYVGTDYGVAVSTDNGTTWFHKMLEAVSPVWGDPLPKMQNSVISILALPNNKAIALSGTGVYRIDERYVQNTPWNWRRIRDGNFIYQWYLSCKNIDVSPLDSNKVFILQDYHNLILYNVSAGISVPIPLPPPPPVLDPGTGRQRVVNGRRVWYEARGPFVRVSRSLKSVSSIDMWVGQGYDLLKWTYTYDELESIANPDPGFQATVVDESWWNRIAKLGNGQGIHVDSGYLGLDNNKLPILYGSDGGLFLPSDTEGTTSTWTGIATGQRGTNSFQISDLAGTNIRSPAGETQTLLYFTTQDNNIWSSLDNGNNWPNADSPEGSWLQVRKDATSETEVRVAYTRISGRPDDYYRFADARLRNSRIPDGGLDKMIDAYYISPNRWIRYRDSAGAPQREIYVSYDNGENWRKRAEVYHNHEGGFAVSGDSSNPVIYTPIKASRTLQNQRKIIGLLKLTDMFPRGLESPLAALPVSTFNDQTDPSPFIYLPNDGSLGVRATEFDYHAVYGVNPNNPYHIIAPDIYSGEVKVSRMSPTGGVSWTTDENLTRAVTKNGELLLYGGDEWHMQVTQISFDPYHPNVILVGTRDAGIIVEEQNGDTWTIPNSELILYITNFFFRRNNIVFVSSYGRGLWKIDFNASEDLFRKELHCRNGDCDIRAPDDPEVLKDPFDWRDKDVTIFLKGHITGLKLSGNEVERITVTPGTIFKRYIGKTKKDYPELNIVEAEKGDGFEGLEGCLAAVQKGEIIKGIILKQNQNQIVGIISGKEEFKEEEQEEEEEERQVDEGAQGGSGENEPGERRHETNSKQPYLFITTNIPLSGNHVLGNDGIIHVFARNFKFDPNGKNDVMITVDSIPIEQTAKVREDGTIQSQVEVHPNDLSYGKHIVQIIQHLDNEEITAIESFVKASVD
jgi:hypothetical protein